MRIDELLSPLPVDRFRSEYFGQWPLHVPAAPDADRKRLLDWDGLNALLAIRPHWTEENILLLLNSRPVSPDLYMEAPEDRPGARRLADPAKVDVFLAMGASLVGNFVEDLVPRIRALTASLGDSFSARASANLYCSFHGIQAFASHCDLHEVFAVQCEGEKVWNIYENRAAFPVVALTGEDPQRTIDAAKGRVAMQVHMRPGDMLYIPRGFYHDALASGGASLHLTFAVAPLTGRAIFRLLEQQAIEDEAFRHYLPDARLDGGHSLDDRLALLAEKLAGLARSPRLAAEIANRQRELWAPGHDFGLPNRQKLEFYARSDRAASFETKEDQPILVSEGAEIRLGHLASAAQWLMNRPAFALQELFARYRHLDQEALRGLVVELERLGLLYAYEPTVD